MKRKVIDKNGRLFGAISVIDIIVILVVLVLAVGVYVKFFVLETTSVTAAQQTATYMLEVSSMRGETADLLETGDTLYDTDGLAVGVIKEIEIEDAMSTLSTLDGRNLRVTVPERYDVYLTIEAPCTMQDGKIYVGKTYELNSNYTGYYQTKYVKVRGMITELELAD